MKTAITRVTALALAVLVAFGAFGAPAAFGQDEYPPGGPPTLDLSDPFVCGLGFQGVIGGGTAGYTLSYELSAVDGDPASISLGSYVVAAAGSFVNPAGFIAPLAGLNENFNVVVTATDANGMVSTAEFVAIVRDPCPAPPPAGPTGDPGLPGDELLAIINQLKLVNNAEMSQNAAELAAGNGDAGKAATEAAKAQSAADDAAQILADGKKAGFSKAAIARLEAGSKAAAAAAKAAAAAAASVTAPAVAVPVPSLAFTGASVSLPLAAGAAMIGTGGLAVLFARKRQQRS